MTKPRASGGSAVMNQRTEAPDSLDDFPTPPWATRALTRVVLHKLGIYLRGCSVWEPACGRGIMAAVLGDEGASVFGSDVHRYRKRWGLGSFVGQGPDVIEAPREFDAVITNPPFRLGVDFFERALATAEVVALLCRSNWAEGRERYDRIFGRFPPLAVAQFVERVPMTRGEWKPDASTATAYSWFVWLRGSSVHPRAMWIPPGQREALTLPDDVRRFAGPEGGANG